ncbi:MAG: M48 family metallopeptidase [Schwartzia sp.]|nr:M48 family metallopeptidase [Schwartzia sp. (in: firmicutes)]
MKSFRNKAAAAAAAAVMAFTLAPAPTANAGWGNILGGAIQAAGQYQKADEAMKHYDNDGREEFFGKMKAQYGVNNDPYLNARLDDIMENLTDSVGAVDPTIYEKPYNYFINTDNSFNAFCSLGHNMSVNTGMFNLVANDDEIAVVLAHEMGHGQKEHVRKGLKGRLNAVLAGTVIAGATGIDAIGNILVNNIDAVHVTKPNEWEADNLAFEYITHSQYNPGACAAIWQRVMDKYGSGSSDFVGDIFNPSDHPSHKERRDNYAKKLKEYSGGKVELIFSDKAALIKVNGKDFVTPAADDVMGGNERACFIAGNLAAAYHNGSAGEAYSDGETLYFGEQPVMGVYPGDPSLDELVSSLNKIR